METSSNPISDYLRAHKRAITDAWESVVRREVPMLAPLDRSSLLDHLPEFLEGLARWIEGDTGAARQGFGALVEGHALQRLQYGVDLTSLTKEYALLRSVITRHLLAVPTAEQIREPITRLNEGLDEAIYAAVGRYTQRRDQIRDRFIGILAHDLRTPINTVAMASGAIVASSAHPGDRVHRMGLAIARAAQRMGQMVDDVIELARGQLGGKMQTTLRPENFHDIVEESVAEVRIAHPDRTITVEQEGDLTGVWDRQRVLQLLGNLLSNAISYGEDPIVVRVRESSDRQEVILTVNNKGRAIPTDRLQSLFDPLRLETPGTRKGLGLGLYIVRQIALAHGARCEVQSNDTDGTTISVIWPRTPREQFGPRT